jgi:hypothetical protein
MAHRIYWTKLARICTKLAGEKVFIHASTSMPENVISAVIINPEGYSEIMLNLNIAKDIDITLDALSHEVAHIKFKSDEHGLKFTEQSKEIRRIMGLAYEVNTKCLSKSLKQLNPTVTQNSQ